MYEKNDTMKLIGEESFFEGLETEVEQKKLREQIADILKAHDISEDMIKAGKCSLLLEIAVDSFLLGKIYARK